MRIFATSDVHGYYSIWKKALDEAQIDFENGDKLIILGDLIDRGSESFECLQHAHNLKKTYNNQVEILMGNHEYMFLQVAEMMKQLEDLRAKEATLDEEEKREMDTFLTNFKVAKDRWLNNGGKEAVQSFQKYLGGSNETETTLLAYSYFEPYFNNVKDYHIEDRFAFVHGGFVSDVPLTEQKLEKIVWNRQYEPFIAGEGLEDKMMIHGHTPVLNLDENAVGVYRGEHHIGIDGGVAIERHLTIYNVSEDTYKIYEIKKDSSIL